MPLRFIDNAAFTSRVGIGTNNPTSPLHVFNAGYPQMALESNGGTWQVGVSTGNDLAFRRGTSGSNYPLWLDSSDNVGIGTTNPGAKLDVNGNISINAGQKIQLSGSSDSTHHIYHDSSTDYDKVNYSSGFQLEHNVSGIQFALVGGTGNVGIGTTSPAQKLHIDGNFLLENNKEIRQKDSGGNQRTIIELDSSNDLNIGGSYAGALKFIGGGSYAEVMRIHDNGNVGIGTTNPLYKLSVEGSVAVQDAQNLWIRGGRIGFENTALNNAAYIYNIGASGSSKLNIADSLYVIEAGNVGIGTTSPSERLDVDGKIRARSWFTGVDNTNTLYSSTSTGVYLQGSSFTGAGSVISFRRTDGSIKAVVNTETGNVGIGTTNPSYKFDVRADDGDVGQVFIKGGNSTVTAVGEINSELLFGSNDASVGQGNIGGKISSVTETDNGAYTGMAFYTYRQTSPLLTEKMRISSGGNVGIGTTAPSNKLEVVGSNAVRIHDGIDQGSIFFRGDRDDVYIKESNYQLLFGAPSGMVFELDTNLNNGDFFNVTHRGSSRMYIDGATGNVGIGTTNPSHKLEVSAKGTQLGSSGYYINSSFADTDSNVGVFIAHNDTSNGVGAIAGVNELSFVTYGTSWGERMRIDGSGNVGIGTTNPASKLHLSDTAVILTTTSTNGVSGFIHNVIGGATALYRLQNNGSERLRITSAGNVGIGTTNPAAGLQVAKGGTTIPVAGSSTASAVFGNSTSDDNYGVAIGANSSGVGYISSQRTDGNATTYNLTIQPNGGNVGIGTSNPASRFHIYQPSGATGFRLTRSNNITGVGLNITVDSSKNIISGYGDLTFRTSTTGNGTNASERMRIDTSGNVGIGTTNPSQKLQIFESGNSAYKSYTSTNAGAILTSYQSQGNPYTKTTDLVAASDGTVPSEIRLLTRTNGSSTVDERMRITSGGNVGIGTTSIANAKLKVAGGGVDIESATDSLRLRFYEGATFKSGIQQVLNIGEMITASAVGDMAIRASAGNMLFATGGSTEKMRIDTSGNVGIGTTNPAFKLDVSGTVRANTHLVTPLIYSGGGNVVFGNVAQFNDFVGIGETAPLVPLHVSKNSASGENIALILDNNDTTAGNEIGMLFRSAVGSTNTDFEIFGKSNSANAMDLVFQSDGSVERMRITSGGNVGIGTTSPDRPLSVIGSFSLDDSSSSPTAGLLFSPSSGANRIFSRTSNTVGIAVPLDIYSGSTLSMRIDASGNVGIGTTSPQQELHVEGFTRTTTLEANGLTGSINLGYGANFKGGLFNDQYLTGDPANSIDDLVTYAPYKYHITVGTPTSKVITVDSSSNVDIDGNIHVTGSTRLDSGGGQQPGFLPNQTPADAIVRIGGAPEIYLSEPDEWLTINIGGTDYVIPAYLP